MTVFLLRFLLKFLECNIQTALAEVLRFQRPKRDQCPTTITCFYFKSDYGCSFSIEFLTKIPDFNIQHYKQYAIICWHTFLLFRGPSWSWSYDSWICNFLYNQCLSPPKLWVWIPLMAGVLDTTLCDKVCHWLVTGQWFSPGTPVSSVNKTDNHDIAEILLKVALNTITPCLLLRSDE